MAQDPGRERQSTADHRAGEDRLGRQSERGAVSIVALSLILLLVVIPLVVAGGSMLGAVLGQQKEVDQGIAQNGANAIALSGAQDALARLDSDPGLSEAYKLASNGGAAWVTVTHWGGDGADNDGNGSIDDAAEQGLVGVRSEGVLNADFDAAGTVVAGPGAFLRSIVQVILRQKQIDLEINQAIYMDDPMADLLIAGNAFAISGLALDEEGNPTGDADLPGIGVAGDTLYVTSLIESLQEDNIVGSGGCPSVEEVSLFDVPSTLQELSPHADLCWNDEESTHTGLLGTAELPVIARANGDLRLYGNTPGFGVLMVEGDLVLEGAFNYTGVVIVDGNVYFRGGGGDKDLTGALFCTGLVSIDGTVQVRHSPTVLSQLTAGFEVMSWSQK